MKRYCQNCQQEFEFAIKSSKDLENLVCPSCGAHVPKDCRKPVDRSETDNTSVQIGRGMSGIFHFMYMFYVLVGLIGVLGYVFKLDSLLIGATAVSLLVYGFQILTHTTTFGLGVLLIPIGAAVCFYFFKTYQGALLGVHLVFIIRHLIRDIIFKLIWKFIAWTSKL